jgi:putative hydrolase of the HAD superfamily
VTPREGQRPVEAVVFDWGGTLSPWHEVDLGDGVLAAEHSTVPVDGRTAVAADG